MGGFVLEIDPTTEPYIPAMIDRHSPLRLTLTSRGVRLLTKCGHIPYISEEFISDKSKADSLAKTLVCFQAAWFVIQILARLAAHLPITLLEINTLGHVGCALMIYLCWWHKPLDISVPTVLTGEWIPPICAYMWMSSTISGIAPAAHPGKPELRSLTYHPARSTEEEHGAYQGSSPSEVVPFSDEVPESSTSIVRLERGQTLANTGFELNRQWRYSNPPSHVDLRPVDVRRWELASEALRVIPAVRASFEHFSEVVYSAGDELLAKTAPNWPANELVETEDNIVFQAITLSLGSMVYGGLHAAAWNAFFPTAIERWMWRISSICIISSGLIIPSIFTILNIFGLVNGAFADRFGLSLFLIFVYLSCKSFLVVEAFLSIRALPLTAYQTADWTQLIPHF
jgi:hypothetical protein